jgi:U3 small nucleolar ribonucleoprotein protein LCP5
MAELLLEYLLNLAYLFAVRLQGKSISSHPAINHLVESRVILEKLKPVENKTKYQIDKLVRAAVVGEQEASSAPEAANNIGTSVD